MTEKPLHSDNRSLLTTDDIIKIKDELIDLVTYILKELRTQVQDKKDIMFMYSLARAVTQIESISTLYNLTHISDCLILYRTQVERLLTLFHLIDSDTIQDFDDWSFIQNFETRNKAKSDREQKDHLNPKFWKESEKRLKRYQRLKYAGVNWIRPKSDEFEKIAKRHDVFELYKYGYKYASGFVHPLASDGEDDFGLVIGMKARNKVELDTRPIINNALVVFIFIVDFALDEMNFEWNEYVFKFLNSCKDSIRNGTNCYKENKRIIDGFRKNNLPIYRKYGN